MTEWSKYQRAIFAHVEEAPERHLVIEAVAGSGKSTTIVEAVGYSQHRRKLVCAFNKSIQRELEAKSRGAFDAKTFHGLGLAAITRAYGRAAISETKDAECAERAAIEAGEVYVDRAGKRRGKHAAKVRRLAGLGKNVLAEDAERLRELAVEHDLDEDGECPRLPEIALRAMELAAEDKAAVSFDDMVWFPGRFGLRPQSHDLICVDETQDMNAAQLYLIQATVRPRGQVICVGDRKQAIYQFRGADSAAMDRIKRQLGAAELPLSISYRCPRAVARLAQEIVPHFQHAPAAEEGLVEHGLPEEALFAGARPGDLVISRKKAPLLGVAFKLAGREVPVTILGRDIAKAIVERIERLSQSGEVMDLAGLVRWGKEHAASVREIYGEDRPEKVEEAEDQAAMYELLAERSSSLLDATQRVQRLFSDDGDARARVVLSTTHKAKGLERDRVWMLGDTYRVWSGPQWEADRNLYYVAVTRARRELRIIGEVRR